MNRITNEDLLTIKSEMKKLSTMLGKLKLDEADMRKIAKEEEKLKEEQKREKDKSKFKFTKEHLEAVVNAFINFNGLEECELGDDWQSSYQTQDFMREHHSEDLEKIDNILSKARKELCSLCQPWVVETEPTEAKVTPYQQRRRKFQLV